MTLNINKYEMVGETIKPLKLLLVEDAEMLQKLQAAMFTKFGHTLSIACNGEQALQTLNQEHFDVILMDLMMPGMDGFECTKHIRNLGITTPIIALSGNDDTETQNTCFDVGMNGFLKKPTNKSAFDIMMRHVLPQ